MNSSVCTTPACLQAAAQYIQNLSPDYRTLNPCANFEQLVCDGWRQTHSIRPDQGMIDAIGLVSDFGDALLKSILEGPYPGSAQNISVTLDQQNFNEVQRAYNVCMALPEIQKAGIAPLEEVLDELNATFDSSAQRLERLHLVPGATGNRGLGPPQHRPLMTRSLYVCLPVVKATVHAESAWL